MSTHSTTATSPYGHPYIYEAEMPSGDHFRRDPDLTVTLDRAGVRQAEVLAASFVVSFDRDHEAGSIVITDATETAPADLRGAAEVLRRVADQLERIEGRR